jgi:predicted transcriptional regulator
MARSPKDVTDTELAVLAVLWEQGEATVRRMAELLYDGCQTPTVQKLLDRLEDKEYVHPNRQLWQHTYRATIARGDIVLHRLRRTADQLCDSSLSEILLHVIRSNALCDTNGRLCVAC